MTLRHMRIFRALYDNDCNTTKTAEALNMTQPAVSQAIKELEQYYGVSLFDRVGRKLVITEAGMVLLKYAVHISSLFEIAEKEVKDFEPILALDGGKDGLDFYRAIAKAAPEYLNKNGVLLLECGIGQAQQICDMLSSFSNVEVIKDYENIDRIIKAVY